jgi:hypothetical protein
MITIENIAGVAVNVDPGAIWTVQLLDEGDASGLIMLDPDEARELASALVRAADVADSA